MIEADEPKKAKNGAIGMCLTCASMQLAGRRAARGVARRVHGAWGDIAHTGSGAYNAYINFRYTEPVGYSLYGFSYKLLARAPER